MHCIRFNHLLALVAHLSQLANRTSYSCLLAHLRDRIPVYVAVFDNCNMHTSLFVCGRRHMQADEVRRNGWNEQTKRNERHRFYFGSFKDEAIASMSDRSKFKLCY